MDYEATHSSLDGLDLAPGGGMYDAQRLNGLSRQLQQASGKMGIKSSNSFPSMPFCS